MQRRRFLPWTLCNLLRRQELRAAAGGPDGSWVAVTAHGEVVDHRAPPGLADHLRAAGSDIRSVSLGSGSAWATVSVDGRVRHHGLDPTTAAGLDTAAARGPLRALSLGASGWVAVGDAGTSWSNLPWGCSQVLTNLEHDSCPPDRVLIGPGEEWLVVADGHLWCAGIPRGLRSALVEALRAGRRIDAVARIRARGWLVRSGPTGPPPHPGPLVRYERGGSRPDILDRLRQSQVPGASVAAVLAGTPTGVYCHGLRRSGTNEPVEPDTVFQAASLSKPVTALAVLQLVAEGRLPLDEDVRTLCAHPLPVHPLVGSPDVEPPGPTVRRLLAHRGGISGRTTSPDTTGSRFSDGGGGSLRLLRGDGVAVPSLEESWHGARRHHPICITYPPGSRVSYSGAGYLILQHLVEEATGRAFAAHVRDALFVPIGCHLSTFDLQPPLPWTLATGHDPRGRPLPGERELVPWAAAGGLYSTAGDLARILTTIVARGRGPSGVEILPPELGELMVEEGLGVFRRPPLIRHGGDNRGFRAVMIADPRSRDGVVVVTNGRAADGVRLRNDLAARLRDALPTR